MLLEEILASDNLRLAWEHVRDNKGAAGIDDTQIGDYLQWINPRWESLKRGLEKGFYCPQPVRRVEIPKGNGDMRQLGIPTVHDRVIQQAINQILQPIFNPHFSPSSYGFRPCLSAIHAVLSVRNAIKDGYSYAVDIDLSCFF